MAERPAMSNCPTRHQGNSHGLLNRQGISCNVCMVENKHWPSRSVRFNSSNCPTRHQGNSHGLLNRQGIACNECMQCTPEMDVCKTMHRQGPNGVLNSICPAARQDIK